MGFLNDKAGQKPRRKGRAPRGRGAHQLRSQATRRGFFEVMEPRTMLDAAPVYVGATYLESDTGTDTHGDTFEVTFRGGAPGTELTRLVINGDQNASGLSIGDMIFDTVKGELGAGAAFPFTVVSLAAGDPQATPPTVKATVTDGSSQLVLDFTGFHAGDKLVFTIDVDEVQRYKSEWDLATANQNVDPIASGVEFAQSLLSASFSAAHYYDGSATGEFLDSYDSLLTGTGLDLRRDADGGFPDRSAGAVAQLQQRPLPAAISGFVYHDRDQDGRRDPGEEGLANVALQVIPTDAPESQTAVSVMTDALGYYSATGLAPGTYQILQPQDPPGYLDGLVTAGTVDGIASGVAVHPGDRIDSILLTGGARGQEYNFGELRPATIAGSVHLTSPHGDCWEPGGTQPAIPGVAIVLRDQQGATVAQTTTDSLGNYQFAGLRPGSYTIVETTPAGLISGDSDVGTVDGVSSGESISSDILRGVVVGSGQQGQNYNFCEHEPAAISGFVYYDANENGRRDPSETGLADVKLTLRDATGLALAQTRSQADGSYTFTSLMAGTYGLSEAQPAGYLDGLDAAGSVGGESRGTAVNPGDELRGIALAWGEQGEEFDFGELLSGSIEGLVHTDLNGDRQFDAGELPLPGVQVELRNAAGQLLDTAETDATGHYRFTDLAPGTYTLHEQQPLGYFQGGQRAGTGGGDDSLEDVISQIALASNGKLLNYNFCEVPPSSLSGVVFADRNMNLQVDAGEQVLAGVTIRLLDAHGNVRAVTQTDANGGYQFTTLAPGTYAVQEEQPGTYFDGGQRAGTHGGDAGGVNLISRIVITGGQELQHYDFAERAPGSLSGYVFQDGGPIATPDGNPPERIRQYRDGRLDAGDKLLPGAMLELRDGISGDVITGEQLLPGQYPSGPVRTVTDQNGYYEFHGLPRGSYAVYALTPAGYADGIDTPGTTGGLAINPEDGVDPLIIRRYAQAPEHDAIVLIPVGVGISSEQNNFSVVAIERLPPEPPTPEPPEPPTPDVPPPDVPPPPAPPVAPERPAAPPLPPPVILVPPAALPQTIASFGARGGVVDFTWHLSVIDAGKPRGQRESVPLNGLVLHRASTLDQAEWGRQRLREGKWILRTKLDGAEGESELREFQFGLRGAIPIVGDFNGDGVDEVGLYYKGRWFLDLNGNGRWDDDDLWAQLGGEHDYPVTGDWNGDGKDDIGIFGPAWSDDVRALEAESGLPDLHNHTPPGKKPKNMPPKAEEATSGVRLLKRSSQGTLQAHVIDHVFRYGAGQQIPVVGDWNGDGVKNIGVFQDGRWYLDMDGDGRWSEGDKIVHFGEPGDIPVVGDFNGDGIDEIGVYRQGKWIIDTNRNYRIDASDKVFQMGEAGDVPVVGDWDGDGRDDPGLYREQESSAELQAKQPAAPPAATVQE